MRHFNTGGVCDPRKHYMVPAEARLPEVGELVDREAYFAVHAPRQSGKTTSLRAIAKRLTAEGRYAALHFSCEVGQALGDDYEAIERALLIAIRDQAAEGLPPEVRPPPGWPPEGAPGIRLNHALKTWASACPRPLVLVFDEIDALWGRGLESVLRQLRSGHPDRPGHFPSSVILCGLRDVRDLRRILEGFQDFWLEHGEALTPRMPYHEAACQLILMAWLQRIVNGGGFIDREYGIGRGRIDLLVRWPWKDPEGRRRWQREVLELKVWASSRPDPLQKGLTQLDGYLSQTGQETGVLVIFDRRPEAAPMEERVRFEAATTPSGRKVTVFRA